MTESHVKPQLIMDILNLDNPNNKSNGRHIYNAIKKHKSQKRIGRSVMQQLMKLLIDHDYHQWHRVEPETNNVSDLLFAHPRSIDLLNVLCFAYGFYL